MHRNDVEQTPFPFYFVYLLLLLFFSDAAAAAAVDGRWQLFNVSRHRQTKKR